MWSCQHGTLSSQAPRLITSMPHLSKNRVSTEVGSSTSPTPSTMAIFGRVGAVPEWSFGRGPIHCFPTSHATRLDSEIFRTLLLRRLRLHLPLNARVCRCGRLLDCLGHHRSACAVSGALGRRGFEVEVAVARICREGARVSTNVMVREFVAGSRRGRQTVGSRCRRVACSEAPNSRLT